ncbi:MAG: hypothetical protein E7329_01095 [Clostridiales bacterium]|nr:hypothetical protein [Clostridiales bacterium]
MLAIAYFLLYEVCGLAIIGLLRPQIRPIPRAWLGLCLGLVLMMWLPALCALIWDFTLAAHLWAMVPLFLLVGGAYLGRDRRSPMPFGDEDKKQLRLLLFTALPLTLVGAYLQWTHNIMPASDGSLHVGQSTYGDLPLHLSIITSLRNASFPADYSIFPGELLSYPFLTDSLSTTLMLFGFSLRASVVFPGIWMMALTFSGYMLLSIRVADTKKGAVLATLFFFINGGLGFFYLFDMQGAVLGSSGENELQSVAGLWNRIEAVLHGWYQTPANHAEFTTYNLRWSNVIVDMMVPQRTTLGGWTQLLPCLYLLYDGIRPENAQKAGISMAITQDGPTAVYVKRRMDGRQAILLGIWAGMLPMINTHCFLALGLLSMGWMAYDLIQSRGQRMRALLFWGCYGLLAVAAALPQLFTWTFRQSVGNEQFLNFQFNWVNGDQGMLDGYFWFYLKNIGIPFLLILLALLEKNEKRRFLASGAFVIYLAAELIQFQPNVYDNNKLLYVWYMICAVIAADYGLELLGKLKGMRAKPVLAALCAFACFFTGALAIARECKSGYQMFSRQEVEAAEFVEEHTEKDATFVTWTQHINFVSSLAGRKIICGPDTWLYYHGFSTWERQVAIRDFYADPMGNLDLLEEYGADYILVSGNERYNLTIDTHAFENYFEKVYESEYGEIIIYAHPGE